MAQQYPIVNGPNKMDLMLALFDGDNKHRRLVTFSVEYPSSGMPHMPVPERVEINSVERIGHEIWIFEGIVIRGKKDRFSPVRGTYLGYRRKGSLLFP